MSRIASVLALLGLLAIPAVAAASGSNSVTVVGTQTSIHQRGKTVTFTETLRLGKKVSGTDKITCRATRTANVYNCTGVYTLSNGTITVAGRDNIKRQNNQVAITGGTGAYSGATGTLKLHDMNQTQTRETFTFTS